MAGNDDLHPILSSIHETLGDVLKAIQELQGEVTKVHTAITEGVETLREAIHESIQAQAELKMMERVVEVRSIRPQIEAEQERVEVEKEELDRKLDRIAERYEEKHEELDEKAAERIRDLGAHIFEIDEQEFEKGIEEPFVENITTVWRTLQAKNETVERDRREKVESTTGEVVGEIHNFVDQQNELIDQIRDVRTDITPSISGPTTVQVPFYVVTVESDEGTEQQLVAPSQTKQTDGPCTVSLEPLPGMEDLVAPTDLNRPQTATIDGSTISEAVTPHIEDEKPLLSYSSAFEETLSEEVEVVTEGGG